jgi:hypothetical protein
MAKIETITPPPLAHYNNIADYIPRYGDYVIWSGWFTTWHGIVVDFSVQTGEVSIIFSGLMSLLLTLRPDEQAKDTRKIKLTKIQDSSYGTWTAQQHDQTRNVNIWYI